MNYEMPSSRMKNDKTGIKSQGGIQSFCSPVILERRNEYSVVLNLLGIDERDIVIDVNEAKREFGIYAGQKSRTKKNASFWVFGVPRDALLGEISVKCQGGGIQVTVPKTPAIKWPTFIFDQKLVTLRVGA